MSISPRKKPAPRVLTVVAANQLTPNMIRVTLHSDSLAGIDADCTGANCKIFIPDVGQSREEFSELLENGRPIVRTYTVRNWRPDALEIDIDFVAHGDEGPASAWAMRAKPGGFIGFRGPSEVKIAAFEADWYLFAADMSAIPVAAANLEKMPRDAKGIAIFEVETEEDRQEIDAPVGMKQHWIVQGDPHKASSRQEDLVRSLDWPKGRIQTCIAGESSVIKALRGFLHREKNLPRDDTYISGYWKIGLIEDEHQKMKRAEAAAG